MTLDPEDLARKHLATKDIGDEEFPLEANLETDLHTDHPLVGKDVEVSDLATELLRNHRGDRCTITGVIIKHGQIAGFRVEIEGKKFYAPKKDFFIDRQYVENIHIDTPLSASVKAALRHWATQRDYYGPMWEGVEAFCYALANATDTAGVQAAGWYKYPGSKRSDMDGKDWRYIVPDRSGQHVVVNCHSLMHDAVWTLSTTIFSTREISKVEPISSSDHWQRTLMWTWATAQMLATHGYDYTAVISEYHRRIASLPELRKTARALMPDLVEGRREVLGGEAPSLPSFTIGPSLVRLRPNTVGQHEPPTDGRDYSIISITPEALHQPEYLSEIVTHEMVHYALGTECSQDSHGDDFQAMADRIGLPVQSSD